MQIKQRRLDLETTRFFVFENSLEVPHTKNVIELSILRLLTENWRRRVWMKSIKDIDGETACAISP
jgi:hypothetical protein